MKKFNKKISLILGTTVLAIGLMAVPAVANTANQDTANIPPTWNIPYGYSMMNGFGGYGFTENDNSNVDDYVYGNGYGMGGYTGYGMMNGYGGNGMMW